MTFKKLALAAVVSAFAAPVFAADCSIDVEGNDAMQFNTKEIEVSKSCDEFTVNLKHTGKLPVAAMGHNLVITKEADAEAVATDGVAAGADSDYIKEDDDRIIAHTKLLGGGEEDSVTFDVSDLDADEDYEF